MAVRGGSRLPGGVPGAGAWPAPRRGKGGATGAFAMHGNGVTTWGEVMPPEPNGHNNDLDTRYQRYFSNIGTQTSPRPSPPGRRRGRRTLAVVGVISAILLGLFGGMALGARDQPRTTVITRTVPDPAGCKEAVAQANRSLTQAVKIEKAMAEHTEYMNLLMEGKIDSNTAMRRGLPSLISGASASVAFDQAMKDYRRVVKTCNLP
jgi:hypothetical protein